MFADERQRPRSSHRNRNKYNPGTTMKSHGTIYATAVAVFGGTTQPIIAWLTHATGNPLSPAWYMMAFTVIGLVASFLMKETAHSRIPFTLADAPIA